MSRKGLHRSLKSNTYLLVWWVNGFQPQELANKISDARKGSILFATSRSLVHISLLSPCSPRLFCPYHRGEGEMLEAFMEVVVRFVMLLWQTECIAGTEEVACAVHFSPACHFSFEEYSVIWSISSIQKTWKWICHQCRTLLDILMIKTILNTYNNQDIFQYTFFFTQQIWVFLM